ncbi:MAG: hypothetical protein ABSF18_02080 [Gammaproteobacteria bacterium]|jgi:anti-anti-sigma regulatory factor
MNELPAKIYFGRVNSLFILKITGMLRFNQCAPLEHFLKTTLHKKLDHCLLVDLSDAQLLDSTALGLLAQIALQFAQVNHKQPDLYCPENDLKKVLLSMSLENLFHFVSSAPQAELKELSIKSDQDHKQTERVLSAHQALMELSEKNKKEFKTVVELLQNTLKNS